MFKHIMTSAVVALSFLPACGPVEEPRTPSAEPREVLDEERAEVCGTVPYGCFPVGSPEETRVLAVLNGATSLKLRQVFSLSKAQEYRVRTYRDGPDGLFRTEDDRHFSSAIDVRQRTGFTCCTLQRIDGVALNVASCDGDDGLCPARCSSRDDGNCTPSAPVCGDANQQTGEGIITSCEAGDACCPSGCTSRTDADCPQTEYAIGQDAQLGGLYVDDDVLVSVNGVEVFRDWNRANGAVSPIFTAVPGDTVTMKFYDTVGGARQHNEIWLNGPGLVPHRVAEGFSGSMTNYRAQPNQPFSLVSFVIPSQGTAVLSCLPEEPLDVASWSRNSALTVHEATTKRYRARWGVAGSNDHGTWPAEYDFTADCQGWVQDVFVAGSGAWAVVQWNTITNRMRTYPVSGHPYNPSVASACARHAISTLFPAGEIASLQIMY
jgi:hypothetical protein